jgi:hypothetical protein
MVLNNIGVAMQVHSGLIKTVSEMHEFEWNSAVSQQIPFELFLHCLHSSAVNMV